LKETGVTGMVTDRTPSFPTGDPEVPPRPNPSPRANPEAVIPFLDPIPASSPVGVVGESKTEEANGLELLGGVAAKLVEKKALDLELAACDTVGVGG
jgi:hypothetical protein